MFWKDCWKDCGKKYSEKIGVCLSYGRERKGSALTEDGIKEKRKAANERSVKDEESESLLIPSDQEKKPSILYVEIWIRNTSRSDFSRSNTSRFLIVRGMICLTIVRFSFCCNQRCMQQKEKGRSVKMERERRKSSAKTSSFRWSGTLGEKVRKRMKEIGNRETRILRSVLVLILSVSLQTYF